MDDKKIEVLVCSGTLCYLMGGSELQLLSECLPPDLRGMVDVKGSPCLDFCNHPKNGRPPFATINGRCIAQASVSLLITEIRKEIKG